MNDQRLLDAIRGRAQRDARAFRERFPSDQPNEKWLENSFTAALPLAKDDAGINADAALDPVLFAAYKAAATAVLGMTAPPRPDSERDRKDDVHQLAEPTPGEN